jgi:hypothetical protein
MEGAISFLQRGDLVRAVIEGPNGETYEATVNVNAFRGEAMEGLGFDPYAQDELSGRLWRKIKRKTKKAFKSPKAAAKTLLLKPITAPMTAAHKITHHPKIEKLHKQVQDTVGNLLPITKPFIRIHNSLASKTHKLGGKITGDKKAWGKTATTEKTAKGAELLSAAASAAATSSGKAGADASAKISAVVPKVPPAAAAALKKERSKLTAGAIRKATAGLPARERAIVQKALALRHKEDEAAIELAKKAAAREAVRKVVAKKPAKPAKKKPAARRAPPRVAAPKAPAAKPGFFVVVHPNGQVINVPVAKVA